MGTPRKDPVLVAGGGIGELAAALALTRQGLRVRILERAAGLGEIGAGIQLGGLDIPVVADLGCTFREDHAGPDASLTRPAGPGWTSYRICAMEELVLFSFSDRVVQEKLGLFRVERSSAPCEPR